MDGARQAIRWSIPGFIFVLEVHILYAAWTVTLGSDPFTSALSADVMPTLAIVFAGIPLGFLLYQLYYRNYKPLGRSMLLVFRHPFAALRGRYGMKSRWTFVRRDRGAEILRVYDERGGTSAFIGRVWPGREHLASELADVTRHRKILGRFGPRSLRVLTLGESLHRGCRMGAPIACGACRETYRTRFQFNWSVVIAMIDYAFQHPERVVHPIRICGRLRHLPRTRRSAHRNRHCGDRRHQLPPRGVGGCRDAVANRVGRHRGRGFGLRPVPGAAQCARIRFPGPDNAHGRQSRLVFPLLRGRSALTGARRPFD